MDGKWATSIRIAIVTNPTLTNRSTAVTSLVLTPMFEAVLLVAIVASVGSPDLTTTAYAGVVATFGLAVLTGTVAQVTRDRQLGVLQEVLSFGPWNPAYWLGKIIPPVILGVVPAITSSVGIFVLDSRHDPHGLTLALIAASLTAISGAMVGMAAAVFSVAMSDPFLVSNVAHWVLLAGTGVVLPLAYYPTWLSPIALALPFTAAVELVRGAEAPWFLAIRELLVSGTWFLAGVLSARYSIRLVRSGRKSEEIW